MLIVERIGYEVGKQEEPSEVTKGEKDKAERKALHFSIRMCKMSRWALTFAFITGRVASLAGLGALLHVVMLWTGAVTLSFGAEQKEEWIAGQAVCGLRALAGLAGPAAPLALSCGVFCIISEPRREAKDQYSACPEVGCGGKNHDYKLSAFRIYLLDSLPIILIHLLSLSFLSMNWTLQSLPAICGD